tara:strand:- start:310 stop:438 length:129 start_codon:yes stop_codon:yes gene_type:complete
MLEEMGVFWWFCGCARGNGAREGESIDIKFSVKYPKTRQLFA